MKTYLVTINESSNQKKYTIAADNHSEAYLRAMQIFSNPIANGYVYSVTETNERPTTDTL